MTTSAYCLMVQSLLDGLIPPEPARPGPLRVYLCLDGGGEDVRTLDGGPHDVPAVTDTDTGAKLIASLIASLIATASTTTAQQPARRKLTEVDAEVDGLNAGGGASPDSGAACQKCDTARQDATRATLDPSGTHG